MKSFFFGKLLLSCTRGALCALLLLGAQAGFAQLQTPSGNTPVSQEHETLFPIYKPKPSNTPVSQECEELFRTYRPNTNGGTPVSQECEELFRDYRLNTGGNTPVSQESEALSATYTPKTRGIFGGILGVDAFYEVSNVDGIEDSLQAIKDTLARDRRYTLENVNETRAVVLKTARQLDGAGLYGEAKINILSPIVWKSDQYDDMVFSFGIDYYYAGRSTFTSGGNPIKVESKYTACTDLITDPTNAASITSCATAVAADPELRGCVAGVGVPTLNDLNNCNLFSFSSSSSILLSLNSGPQFSLGVGGSISQINNASAWLSGSINYGVKLKYTALTTSGSLIQYQGVEQRVYFQDLIKTTETESSFFDADLAVQFATQKFDAVYSFGNVLSPKVNYKDPNISEDIKSYHSLALEFYRLFDEQQKNFTLHLSQDLTPRTSIAGVENQWRTFAFSYSPEVFLLPRIRLGRRHSLLRDKMAYTYFGLSMLFFEFNAALSDDQVRLSESSSPLPRSLFFNMNLYYSF